VGTQWRVVILSVHAQQDHDRCNGWSAGVTACFEAASDRVGEESPHPVLSRDRWAKGLKAGLLENSNRADILPGDIRVERSPDIRKRSKAERAAARKKASKKR